MEKAEFLKITRVDLDASKYTTSGGVFVFVLSGSVDDEWKKIFQSKSIDFMMEFGVSGTASIISNNCISAPCDIEEDQGIENCKYFLDKYVQATNTEYAHLLEQKKAEEERIAAAEASLEKRVTEAVNRINF